VSIIPFVDTSHPQVTLARISIKSPNPGRWPLPEGYVFQSVIEVSFRFTIYGM
jgi:hypothetical protein